MIPFSSVLILRKWETSILLTGKGMCFGTFRSGDRANRKRQSPGQACGSTMPAVIAGLAGVFSAILNSGILSWWRLVTCRCQKGQLVRLEIGERECFLPLCFFIWFLLWVCLSACLPAGVGYKLRVGRKSRFWGLGLGLALMVLVFILLRAQEENWPKGAASR